MVEPERPFCLYTTMANTKKELALAHQHLCAGNVSRAQKLYRRIVQRDPANAEAWHLLGIAAAKSGDLVAAATLIGQAIQIAGPEPEWCSNLGRVFVGMGRQREAAACFRQAFARSPMNAGLSLELGVSLAASGQSDDAVLAFEHAADLDESNPEAWFQLGFAHYRAGHLDQAARSYERALTINPQHAETHFSLGVIRMINREIDEAIYCFRQTIELNPDHAEAFNNLGLLEQESNHPDNAVEAFRRAIRLRGGKYYSAEYNLARVLAGQERLEPAKDAYESVVAHCPEHVDARLGLSTALIGLGHTESAVAHLRAALELAPDSVPGKLNLSIALLQLGEWTEAWPLYESRLKGRHADPRTFEKPRWNGAPLQGERVLLHAEQGFGDTIQFARYVSFVRSRGGIPVLECQDPLSKLMTTLDGVDEVIVKGEPLPQHDLHAPLMSLAGIFETTPENTPDDVPYLLADVDDVDAWAGRLRKKVDPKQLRVGLVWAGNPQNKYERTRSIPIEMFDSLSKLEGIAWFNIQKNAGALPLLELFPMIEDCSNFADNAAAIMNLDLVISIDTAIAHLAGALGRPVWTLLPYAADWRWLKNRSDTPWYSTMRLFRQTKRGDWDPVIEEVKRELENLVGARKRP